MEKTFLSLCNSCTHCKSEVFSSSEGTEFNHGYIRKSTCKAAPYLSTDGDSVVEACSRYKRDGFGGEEYD